MYSTTATNDRPFNGVLHTWLEVIGNDIMCDTHVENTVLFIIIGVTPCQLVCLLAEENVLAIQEPVVVDGTPCDNTESSNAICVQGICTVRLMVYTI